MTGDDGQERRPDCEECGFVKREDVPESKAGDDEPRFVERRSDKDRRKTEVSTMGPRDRRKRVEPRKIQVVEVEMSESEWEALFGKREP